MIGVAACVAVWLVLAPAGADEREANPHFAPARAAFEAEDWDTAAREFAAAHAHDGRLEYLYAQAQAERRGGRCEDAMATYQRFIDAGPPPEAIAEARGNIAKCEEERPASPPPPAAAVSVQRVDAPPPEPAPTKHWIRDPWGGVATFGGIAIAAAGGALLGVAHDRERDAERSGDEQDYRDAIAGAPAMSRAGIGLVSVGAALIVAGIVRWSLLAAAARRRPR
jgi:hypothetical protein